MSWRRLPLHTVILYSGTSDSCSHPDALLKSRRECSRCSIRALTQISVRKSSRGNNAHLYPPDRVDPYQVVVALLLLFSLSSASAQTTQFLPEVNTYVALDSRARLFFQAKETRENGEPTQGEIGPSIDFYWRPLSSLPDNHVDQSKTRLVLLSFGYRFLPSPSTSTTNRILMIATPRLPTRSKLVVLDRNRGELNFSRGDLTWRYRNQLQIEREVTIRTYQPTPYAKIEVFYDSMYHKWSSTAIEVGCQFPIRTHTEISLYYEHQNNTGPTPNQQIDAIGLVANLHFRAR
jgi:hypothetical protein